MDAIVAENSQLKVAGGKRDQVAEIISSRDQQQLSRAAEHDKHELQDSTVEALRHELAAERESVASLSTKLDSETDQTAVLMGKISQSELNLSGLKSERDAHFSRILELNAERENWKADQAKVTSLEEQISNLLAERNQIQTDLKNEARASSELRMALDDKVMEQQQVVASLVDQVTELKSSKEYQSLEIIEIRAREASLTSELTKSVNLVSELQRQQVSLTSEERKAARADVEATALSERSAMVSAHINQMADLEAAHKEEISGLWLEWENRASNLKSEAEQKLSVLQKQVQSDAAGLSMAYKEIEHLQGCIEMERAKGVSAAAALEAIQHDLQERSTMVEELR